VATGKSPLPGHGNYPEGWWAKAGPSSTTRPALDFSLDKSEYFDGDSVERTSRDLIDAGVSAIAPAPEGRRPSR
jgi:hypothetical protein